MLDEIIEYLNILQYAPDTTGLLQESEFGTFEIKDGTLNLDIPVIDGQIVVIRGSAVNDGSYVFPCLLQDEKFDGAVYILRANKSFMAAVSEIEKWQSKYGTGAASPYASESFGGYSYTKAGNSNGDNSTTWKKAVGSRLSRWRKL